MGCRRGAVLALGAALVLGAAVEEGRGQRAIPRFGPDEPIPTDYRSWTLFLVCNPRWLRPEANAALRHLWWTFDSFGRAIGPDNAAIWFWTTDDPDLDRISDHIDVERSATYCQKLGLSPSQSPHVVVTLVHPDEADRHDDQHFVAALNGLAPARVEELVNVLADGIIAGGLDQHAIESRRFWLGLQQVVTDAVTSVGDWVDCVSFVIDARLVKVTILGHSPGSACG